MEKMAEWTIEEMEMVAAPKASVEQIWAMEDLVWEWQMRGWI